MADVGRKQAMISQGDWGMERVSSDPEACTSDLRMRNAPTHPVTPLTFSPSYYALVFLCLNPSAVYFLKHSVSLPPTHTPTHIRLLAVGAQLVPPAAGGSEASWLQG